MHATFSSPATFCTLYTFGLLSCETFTRQPENSKGAHLRVPALQTPPKCHEKTSKRGKNERKIVAEEGKKARNFGPPHPSAPSVYGFGHTLQAPHPSDHHSGRPPLKAPPTLRTPPLSWPKSNTPKWPKQDTQKLAEIEHLKIGRSRIGRRRKNKLAEVDPAPRERPTVSSLIMAVWCNGQFTPAHSGFAAVCSSKNRGGAISWSWRRWPNRLWPTL